MRDDIGQTRGVGFVTFFTLQAATHTLAASGGAVTIDGVESRCAFTRGAPRGAGRG